MLQTRLHKLDARPLTDCGRNTGIPKANDINLITDIVTVIIALKLLGFLTALSVAV